ncbi:hypothetical protein [Pseudomonas phage K4]|nr:hypothetical protein [Pseudomonas phage K4]
MIRLNMDFLLLTRAAQQVKNFCKQTGLDEGVIMEVLRSRCERQWIKREEDGKTVTYDGEGWIVDDDPLHIDIDKALIWDNTPEGHNYWSGINRY